MITKMLKVTLAASMALPAVSTILNNPTVLAEEIPAEAVHETEAASPAEVPADMETVIVPEDAVLPETAGDAVETPGFAAKEEAETVLAEVDEETEMAAETDEENGMDAHRGGTDVTCGLNLDVLVNGVQMETAEYQAAQGDSDVQLGGTLNLKKVWAQYDVFKAAYALKNGMPAFRSKSLLGSYTYTFYVNPEVVTVNEEIMCDPAAWQDAFETGSPEASVFFSYMRCSDVKYAPASGKVDVIFTINEKGTGLVSVATIEDGGRSAKPEEIQAYSPKGAMTIKAENFKKGAGVFAREATFKGEIDMSPWMALIFPIRFEACVKQHGLTLDVADAQVTFDVENGTWADGTNATLTRNVEVDVIKLSEGTHVVAGTLMEDMIPEGMIAAEGYDQEKGAWDRELNTEENGLVFHEGGISTMSEDGNGVLTIGYTYSFPGKAADPKPVDPTDPAFPGEEENKPGDNDAEKPGDDNPDKPDSEDRKPEADKDEDTKPSGSRPASKVPTAAATGLAATLGLQALSVAGIVAILKRKRR